MKATLAVALLCAAMAVGATGQARTGREGAPAMLRLGKAVQYGRIAVVPIIVRRPLSAEKYLTLTEAIKMGVVEIVEVPGSAQVNSLEVRNRASLPLLLVAGELLLGGKQDRIVAKDTIVPPRESRQVPVFCVEHGRWTGGKMSFEPADTFVPDIVRSTANEKQSQTEVWQEVAAANDKAGARTSTGTVRALVTDPKVARSAQQTTAKLQRAFEGVPDAVGIICWLDGRIHSADLFANPALFAASQGKLIRSYCADMVLADTPRTVPVDMKACADFLAAIASSRRSLADRDRYNSRFVIKDGKVSGFESGGGQFGGGLGGAAMGGFGHGTYKPSGR